ncbi:hypothetical protein OROGR_029464 [Orobanche gracilis]
MDDSSMSPDEVNSLSGIGASAGGKSVARLNKKRKLQKEPRGTPLAKHVCCDQSPKGQELSREIESDQESAEGSNSFRYNPGLDQETRTDLNMHAISNEPCTLSGIGVHSLESGSLTATWSSGPESSSTNTGQLDSLNHEYGMQNPDLDYDGVEKCTESEIKNLLCWSEMDASNYMLSSVRQGTKQEGKKLTIDKEFEQYFSMLLL